MLSSTTTEMVLKLEPLANTSFTPADITTRFTITVFNVSQDVITAQTSVSSGFNIIMNISTTPK